MKKNKMQRFLTDWLPPIAVLLIIIVAWETVTTGLHLFNEMVLPSLSSILRDTGEFLNLQTGDYSSTLKNVFLGYVLSVPAGIVLAGLLAQSKVAIKACSPLVIVLAVTPMLVLVPVLVMWTSFAPWTRTLAVAIQTMPIILLNTLTGFTNVPAEKEELAMVYGASRAKRFFKIVVPQAWPQIFTGLRMGVVNAALGIVCTEFVVLGQGLGYRIIVSCSMLQFPVVYGCILLVAVTSYLLMMVVTLIENKVVVWK